MSTKRKLVDGSAEAEFLERLDLIEKRAKKLGMTMPVVCGGSGVARATPERWRRKVPQSVLLLDKLEAYVAGEEKKAANQ
jgi:hypothetical protein